MLGVGLDEDGVPIFVGALNTFTELWNETKCDLLERLKSLFQTLDNDSAKFNRAEASFDFQLIDLLYGKRPPENPEYFYDIRSGQHYVSDTNAPTHHLSISDDIFVELAEIEGGVIPSGAIPYRSE